MTVHQSESETIKYYPWVIALRVEHNALSISITILKY